MNEVYVIDSNVLMEAHRRYYAFAICPGFWKKLVEQCKAGRIKSLDRVFAEVERGKDDLLRWAKTSVPDGFFEKINDAKVFQNYSAMMQWVQDNPQFNAAAKEEFARDADGWLVAYAQANPGCVVVTLEAYNADVKKHVKIPNLCEHFSVPYTDTFEMLKALNVQFQ